MNPKFLFSKFIEKIQLPSIKDSIIDKHTFVGSRATVYHSRIGKYSYVGNGSCVVHAEIGKFCCIGSGCSVGAGQHPMRYVSMSPVFYQSGNCLKKNFANLNFEEYQHTTIGNDVWIGGGAFVKSGVTIGDGAVIGARAVVTKDVAPYAVAVGIPAKTIKYRFDEETVKKLLKSRWWDMTDKELELFSKRFDDVEQFFEEINL